jgi:hypothetical protein
MHTEHVHESDENGGDYDVDVLDGDETYCECGCNKVGKIDEQTSCDICDRLVVKSCLTSNWKDLDIDVCSSCAGVGPVAILLAQRQQMRRDRSWALRSIADFDNQDKAVDVNDYATRLGHAIGTMDYVKSLLMGGE